MTLRTYWVDATRGIAIVLVALGHAIQVSWSNLDGYFDDPLFASIYSFHMPLFIAISGYVSASSFAKYGFRDLVARRSRGLLVPYAAWTAVNAILFTSASAATGVYPATDLPAQLGERMADAFLRPEATLWFLFALFTITLVVALVHQVPARWRWPALVAAWPALLLVPLDYGLAATQIKWLYPFFVAGMAAFNLRDRIRPAAQWMTAIAIVGWLVLRVFWDRDDTVYLHRMALPGGFSENLSDLSYRYAIAAAGVIAASGIVHVLGSRSTPVWLARIGVASLGVYALQPAMNEAFGLLPLRLSERWYWIAIVAMTASAVTASYLVVSRVIAPNRLLGLMLAGAAPPSSGSRAASDR